MEIQGKTLVKVTNKDITNGKFIVPEGVKEIGDGAFYGCTSLTHIVLPETLRKIGDDAFRDCTALTHIVLPETLRKIGDDAFRDCTALTHIILPEGIKSVGWGAFANCTSLTHIILPDGIVRIGNYAFRGCTSLTSITFPNGKVYSHRCIDGYPFLIENTRQVGNTTIFKGIWLDFYKDGKIIGSNCFVAEREGFTAHGETIREAMDDLEFKIAQAKLQDSPLSMDDEIDVNHYRAITGACKMGVAKWMENNEVTQEKILVRDLLPMLERTNAYGLNKFKSLIK